MLPPRENVRRKEALSPTKVKMRERKDEDQEKERERNPG